MYQVLGQCLPFLSNGIFCHTEGLRERFINVKKQTNKQTKNLKNKSELLFVIVIKIMVVGKVLVTLTDV